MAFRVTIHKTDNARRGNVNRSVEFEQECSVSDMIGAIDGLLRQCFPDDMRHRGLNLSRDTTVPASMGAVTAVNDSLDRSRGADFNPYYRLEQAQAMDAYINGFATPSPTPSIFSTPIFSTTEGN